MDPSMFGPITKGPPPAERPLPSLQEQEKSAPAVKQAPAVAPRPTVTETKAPQSSQEPVKMGSSPSEELARKRADASVKVAGVPAKKSSSIVAAKVASMEAARKEEDPKTKPLPSVPRTRTVRGTLPATPPAAPAGPKPVDYRTANLSN